MQQSSRITYPNIGKLIKQKSVWNHLLSCLKCNFCLAINVDVPSISPASPAEMDEWTMVIPPKILRTSHRNKVKCTKFKTRVMNNTRGSWMVFVVLCPFLKAPNLATDRSFDIGMSGADMYGTHICSMHLDTINLSQMQVNIPYIEHLSIWGIFTYYTFGWFMVNVYDISYTIHESYGKWRIDLSICLLFAIIQSLGRTVTTQSQRGRDCATALSASPFWQSLLLPKVY